MSLINTLLLICNLILLLPVGLLAAECFAAWIPRRLSNFSKARLPVIVMIPAHNEAETLGITLVEIRNQLIAGDRLLVVADNCHDNTAAIAAQAGAEVWERSDQKNRGKGFALAWGLAKADPADDAIVVLIDADTEPAANTLDALAQGVIRSGRPQQAVYLMRLPATPSLLNRISAFAFCVKNQARLCGAQNLRMPCHLTGSGMAFRYAMLKQVNVATDNVVEDMQLGIDLTLRGLAPGLCSAAVVTGVLPADRKTGIQQRRRWEHGHLQTLISNVPRLIRAAISQRRAGLVFLALDLSIPPLALLVLFWAATLALTAIAHAATLAGPIPLYVALLNGLILLGAVLSAWVRFGRDLLPLWSLLYIPFYVLWKVPLYATAIFRRQKTWERTART